MKNLKVCRSCILFVFAALVSLSYAQDISKIVILSDGIGPNIDSTERKEYDILPIFEENFISAIYYLGPDSQYYCSVKLKSGDSVIDSVISMSYVSIKNNAIRVQSMESKQRGDKNFNIENVVLKFADGEDVKNFVNLQSQIKFDKEHLLSSKRKLPTNKLDLNYSEAIKRDFQFGLSAGMVYNSATFDGLNQIFNLLEEIIPEEPYQITKSDFRFKASPLFRFTSMLIFRNIIIGELEYSLSIHDDNYSNLDYKTFAISFSYVIPILKNPFPYVTLGYSASKFSVVKNYNARINDRQGTLESITFDGHAKGLKTSVGLMYNFTPGFGINLYANYKFYPDVEVNLQGYLPVQDVPTVNLNGIELGISFYLLN